MSSRTESAFAEVLAKARGGVIGAAIGGTIILLIFLALGPGFDYRVGLGIGAICGAAGGGTMSGRSSFGVMGSAIITGGWVGIPCVLCHAGEEHLVSLAWFGGAVAAGFTLGGGIELYQATSHAETDAAERTTSL